LAITIRALTDADIPGVCARIAEHQDYHRALEPQWPAGAAVADAYFAYLQAQCAAHLGQIFVAAEGDAIAGFVCVVADKRGSPDDPARHAFVHDLYVAHEFRRRGIGKQLMRTVETFALSHGVTEVRLTALEGNQDAHDLYGTLGFRGYARVLIKTLS
jgi:GNAT superfamily N-acetyltransferase